MNWSKYEDIMNDCVTRIKEAVPTSIDVTKAYQHQSEYKELLPSHKGRVVVMVWQSRSGTEQTVTQLLTGNSVQQCWFYFVVTVSGKKIYGEDGVFHNMERCQAALLGLTSNYWGGEMELFGTEPPMLEDNIWNFQVIIRTSIPMLPYINPREEPALYPGTIKQIDHLEQLHEPYFDDLWQVRK